MRKLPKRRMLLVIAAAFTMLLFSGLVVGGQIREASAKLGEQRDALLAERDRLSKINSARGDYEDQTKRFDESYETMISRFPARITQNNQILFLRNVEDEFGIRIVSASYTDPEEVYQFQSLAPGNEEGYRLMRSTLQFPMTLSYAEWKRFIAYIAETDGREVIESVSADYDVSGSLVDADVTLLQYAITGNDRQDAESTTEVETGTDNIFSSGARFYTGEDNSDESVWQPSDYRNDTPFISEQTNEDAGYGESEMTGEEEGDREDREQDDRGADDEMEEAGEDSENSGRAESQSGIRSSIR
ncbi:MAG: hypothetical protein K6G16_02205 [Lachnospiraceae bacterium]|nr:hypothetical protein [Lachnospiraceae bacterium]